jgi:hypothetical protein
MLRWFPCASSTDGDDGKPCRARLLAETVGDGAPTDVVGAPG